MMIIQIIEDAYGNLNGYQSQCTSISGELMTFCIGGLRYFQNNTLLENSPLWTCLNPANDIHDTDIFRDTKYTYGSPLFRQHYKYPTDPSLNGVDDDEAWWDIDNRENDCFQDANDFGYVATQLSHSPRLIGYDFGNVLTYRSVSDNEEGARLYDLHRSSLSNTSVMKKLFHETSELPFNLRSDSVAIIQCNVLHNPSMYVINRKSLLVNKPHVFYNEDSLDVHCGPLVNNVLKWSEGFLGDCMSIKPVCHYEEPIRNVILDADYAKVSIFEYDNIIYDSVAYPTFEIGCHDVRFTNFPVSSQVSPKVNWSMNAILCEGTLPYFNTLSASGGDFDASSVLPRNCTDESSDSNATCKEWVYEDNLPLMMKNGEKLSLLDALGLCRDHTNDSLHAVNRLPED